MSAHTFHVQAREVADLFRKTHTLYNVYEHNVIEVRTYINRVLLA